MNAATASSAQKRTDVEELALDPNHNYFIFADTPKNDHSKGREAEVRARFERCISLWSTSAPDADAPPQSAARLSQSGAPGKQTSFSSVEPGEDYASVLKRKSTIRRQTTDKTGGEGRPLSRSSSKFKSSGGQGDGATGGGAAGGGAEGGGTTGKDSKSSGEDVRIPMCGLVIGGDRFTLRQVYCSIMQNQCPMVVAKVCLIFYFPRQTFQFSKLWHNPY